MSGNPETAVEAIAMSVRADGERVFHTTDDPHRVWNEFRRLRERGLVTVNIAGHGARFDVDGDVCGRPFAVTVTLAASPPTVEEKLAQAEADRDRLFEMVEAIVRCVPGPGPITHEQWQQLRARVEAARPEVPF